MSPVTHVSNDLFGVAIHPSSPEKDTKSILFLTYVRKKVDLEPWLAKLLHPPNCKINASKAAAQHARNVKTSFSQRLFSIMYWINVLQCYFDVSCLKGVYTTIRLLLRSDLGDHRLPVHKKK